jgi:hypothetical protein
VRDEVCHGWYIRQIVLGWAVEREGGAGQTCSTYEGKEKCTEDFGGHT